MIFIHIPKYFKNDCKLFENIMILAIYCNKLTSAKTLHPEHHFIEEFQNKLPLMKKIIRD